jgi:hypothetical protein
MLLMFGYGIYLFTVIICKLKNRENGAVQKENKLIEI